MCRIIAFILLLSISLADVTAFFNVGRIIGGRDVSITKHPHQVSLRGKNCKMCPYTHDCGGMILNENTILTAAHCVYKREAKSFVIVAGSDYRAGADGLIALVDKIISHEEYNPASQDNDIAIMFLSTPLRLNKVTIWPVEMASEEPKPGAAAVVTGWGTTTSGGLNSDKLQEVDIEIIGSAECTRAYGSERIKADMLCAGTKLGGRDACQNDSGGPLMSMDKLVGVVSWGIGCARPEYPGVYANVAYFRKWIEDKMAKNQ